LVRIEAGLVVDRRGRQFSAARWTTAVIAEELAGTPNRKLAGDVGAQAKRTLAALESGLTADGIKGTGRSMRDPTSRTRNRHARGVSSDTAECGAFLASFSQQSSVS